MQPTIFDHIMTSDIQDLSPKAQGILMARWTALRRGRDPYNSDILAESMIRRAYNHPYYNGPLVMLPGVTQEEEIAQRCQRATLSYAYREPERLLPMREAAREAVSTSHMLGAVIFWLLAILAGIIVFGVTHDLPLPVAFGGR